MRVFCNVPKKGRVGEYRTLLKRPYVHISGRLTLPGVVPCLLWTVPSEPTVFGGGPQPVGTVCDSSDETEFR